MTSKTETRNDRLRAAREKLQDAVAEIVSGDDWKRMLQVAAKFHNYSFNNQLMIFLQRPDATVVAGFNRWRSLGRFVKKGEKGLAIFAPCKYKVRPSSDGPGAASSDGKGNIESGSASAVEVAAPSAQRGDRPKTEIIRGFRVVHVFDISQTEGEELADLYAVRPKLLDGEAPAGIWDALVAHASSVGFEVVRDRKGGENGYCDFVSGRIGVRPDIDGLQAVTVVAAVDGTVGPVVLVGHSGGGAIAHAAADARPGRVARVVYVDTVPLGNGQVINDELPVVNGEIPLPDWSLFGEEDLVDLDEKLRDEFRARAVPHPAAVATDPQVFTDDRRYEVPATVIACEFSVEQLRGWIARGEKYVSELVEMSDVEYVELPTGHWPQFTKPKELGRAIVAAIDRD